jgi:iron complex outermembrane receptor protein
LPKTSSLLRACALGASTWCVAQDSRPATAESEPSLPEATRPVDSAAAAAAEDLTMLSLEDLLDLEIEVTSVSKRKQPLARAPAAVFVLSADEIRRSGLQSIPEALRLVPGLHVARLDSNRWAISSRGFNNQFANKMLVLLDGRTVYTPFFSGVFWDVQDVPLSTVERIEVIRGPGAALWGSNAVNGVINIITRSAADTLGGRAEATAGTDPRGQAVLSYGLALEQDAALRVWTHGQSHAGLRAESSGERVDEWWQGSLGFRLDRGAASGAAWTCEGSAYRGVEHNLATSASFTAPYMVTEDNASEVTGAHLLGRFADTAGPDSDWSLQAYVHRDVRDAVIVGGRIDTFDIAYERRHRVDAEHGLVWGLGLRLIDSEIDATPLFGVHDPERTDVLLSAFVQDEISFDDGRWSLVAGARLEHEEHTGLELQPSLRGAWNVSAERTLWAAVSRALRSPSQLEQGIEYTAAVIPNVGFDMYVQTIGNAELQPEELLAFEIGWRDASWERFALDVAAFYNEYDESITTVPGAPFPSGANLIVPLDYANHGQAQAYGLEAFARWTPAPDQRWTLGYTFLELDTDPESAEDGHSPTHQVQLRYSQDLNEQVQLDLASFWVENLSEDHVPGYVRVDAHLEWNPSPDASWALGVQGMLHQGDIEFGSTDNLWLSSEQEVVVYLQVRTSF